VRDSERVPNDTRSNEQAIVYNWFPLSKDGGGDIDLASYALGPRPRIEVDYIHLP